MHKKNRALSAQELHELGIKWVYKHIKDQYEVLSVNMEINTNPQILARKDDEIHFIVVRTTTYPEIGSILPQSAEQILDHAQKHKAKCLFAHVGIANADAQSEEGMSQPVKNGNYYINYKGLDHMPNIK